MSFFFRRDSVTQARFESRFRRRHVIYRATETDTVGDMTGIVTGFLPEDRVILTTLDGQQYAVSMSRLVNDLGDENAPGRRHEG